MATTIQYGDVTLALVKINSFVSEPVYDDAGIDYLYTHFSLDVSCIYSEDIESPSLCKVSDFATIRGQLVKPRQKLTVKFGEHVMLDVPAPDAKMGPTPRPLVITKVVGSRTIHVQFAVDAFVTECTEPSTVLSNRWSMAFSYDRDFMQSRTTDGVLVLRGVDGADIADSYRNLCIPPLPKGWRRERLRFATSPDGLKLQYSIEDKESEGAIIDGITTASGTYTEISSGALGTTKHAEINLTVRGTKETTKADLFNRAAAIVLSRVNLATQADGGNAAGKDLLEGMAISEALFEPELTMRVRVRRTSQVLLKQIGPVSLNFIGKVLPGSENNTAVDMSDRGTAILLAVIQRFTDPCGIDPEDLDIENGTNKLILTSIDDEATEVTVSQGVLEPEGEPAWDSEHLSHAYTDYQIDISYKTKYHNLALPKANTLEALAADERNLDDDGNVETVSIVPMAAPTQIKKVKWRGERIGEWPRVPLAEDLHGKGVISEKEPVCETPQLTSDGRTYRYAMHGEYLYFMKAPIDETNPSFGGLLAGSLPYDTSTEVANRVPTDRFIPGIATDLGSTG